MQNIRSFTKQLCKQSLNLFLLRRYAANTRKNLPSSLHIETTTICNLDCEYCVLGSNMYDKKVMGITEFKQLTKYFKKVKHISLSGLAEPLLNKNIVEFVKIIKEENGQCGVSIFSNGKLLTEELSARLVESKLDTFEFSLDGVIPEVVDKIRKNGEFSKTIGNLKTFNSIKQRKNSKKPVFIATNILQKKNYQQLPDVVKLASELGVVKLNVNGLEPYKEDMIDNIMWLPGHLPRDLPDVLEETIKVAKEKNVLIGFTSIVPKEPVCYNVVSPLIMANGDVTCCAVLAYDRDYFFILDKENQIVKKHGICKKKIFGNVFETPLEEIWFRDEYKAFRDKVLRTPFPGECSTCLIKHQFICVRSDFSPQSVVREVKELVQKTRLVQERIKM